MAELEKNLPEEELEGPEVITLDDGEGHELNFEIIASLEFNGSNYIGVVEYVEDESQLSDDEQLVILRVGEDEEGEFYDVVEDDEELYAVGSEMEKLLSGEYDIEN